MTGSFSQFFHRHFLDCDRRHRLVEATLSCKARLSIKADRQVPDTGIPDAFEQLGCSMFHRVPIV
jgi:hypothetical protein